MPELEFYTLDVFTSTAFGGNQLAVFPDAPDLPDELMQAITREFNYSETVFVRPSQNPGALRRLRIFTPGAELPFAGHPTIGTAQLLVELGIAKSDSEGVAEFAFEEGVGLVPVSVSRREGGGWFTWLTAARVPDSRPAVASAERLAWMLGLQNEDVVADDPHAPATYSAGVPFTMVPVRNLNALRRASPDAARWREVLAKSDAPDIYVFCHASSQAGADLQVRMFAPTMGIPEDPATGGAAAAFGGYLWKRTGGAGEWVIAQGVEMGRPSTVHVQALGDARGLQSVRVGGSAVRVSRGTMRIP